MSDDASGNDVASRARQINARIDTTRPHPARVYDVFLGGRDNYPADRAAAQAALAANPRGYLNVWHNRDFVRRAVTHLTQDIGIRQYLDIGTGLPTAENVHEIAQRFAPRSRIVYVDNDPVVLTHARALLTSGPEGVTDYLDADLRDPEKILREAERTLAFDRPIALVLAAILHFVEDEAAYDVVARLVAALAPGSHLILSHLTTDLNPENGARVAKSYRDSGMTFVLRPKDKVLRFFTDNGLELIEPGIVPVHHWRPDHRAWPLGARRPIDPELFDHMDGIEKIRYQDINDVTDADVNVYGALAVKR
ncbi:SAM-dependent methyltransferase [Actinocrinis puniceicyclus]|uniref:SAM-dependent methyltransferase n=1 Tax=Actinocrinis puniceicyclus TaxID=977794 RepID=A0A8J7WVD9_9ACTN|nr:SAM-dependent methyltransferase [Actinocrinis puniceicyclus]MBS2965869.1 SAM-dependent methyltransferase [Actinocrinis puniceicyclus]